MTYEGWKEIRKNRYALVGKEYVAGYMTGEEMANITNANLHSKLQFLLLRDIYFLKNMI